MDFFSGHSPAVTVIYANAPWQGMKTMYMHTCMYDVLWFHKMAEHINMDNTGYRIQIRSNSLDMCAADILNNYIHKLNRR